MRILFASYVPHMPESTGGYQTTIDALANILQKRGHEVLGIDASPTLVKVSRNPSSVSTIM